jgi:hypothetical protein
MQWIAGSQDVQHQPAKDRPNEPRQARILYEPPDGDEKIFAPGAVTPDTVPKKSCRFVGISRSLCGSAFLSALAKAVPFGRNFRVKASDSLS